MRRFIQYPIIVNTKKKKNRKPAFKRNSMLLPRIESKAVAKVDPKIKKLSELLSKFGRIRLGSGFSTRSKSGIREMEETVRMILKVGNSIEGLKVSLSGKNNGGGEKDPKKRKKKGDLEKLPYDSVFEILRFYDNRKDFFEFAMTRKSIWKALAGGKIMSNPSIKFIANNVPIPEGKPFLYVHNLDISNYLMNTPKEDLPSWVKKTGSIYKLPYDFFFRFPNLKVLTISDHDLSEAYKALMHWDYEEEFYYKGLESLTIVRRNWVLDVDNIYWVSNLVTLKVLRIKNLYEKALPSLNKLVGLEELTLDGDLSAIPMIGKLVNLERLTLDGDFKTISGLDTLRNLKQLKLDGEFKEISGLDNLRELEQLTLISQSMEVYGLYNLVNLKQLKLVGYLAEMPDLEELKNLEQLTVDGNFEKITGLDNLRNLKDLTLHGEFEEISGLNNLRNLEKLNLNGLLKRISGLDNLRNLVQLTLEGEFEEISGLNNLKNLKQLDLNGGFDEISGLDNLRNLEWLSLDGYFKSMSGLDNLVNLKVLKLKGYVYHDYNTSISISISNIENVKSLLNIDSLDLLYIDDSNILNWRRKLTKRINK